MSKHSGVRNPLGKRMVLYHGFLIMEELLSRCKVQLGAIASLDPIEKQFIGTLVDTESAVGYFIRKTNVSGATWVSYISAKMKYAGDLAYFAKLISHLPPSRGLYANTIKQSLDPRWSLNVQGIVAYSIILQIMPYLHNEKSIIEVDCILKHGPIVNATQPHPFVQCGALRVRRGVWYWPQIDDEPSPLNTTSTAIK
jgi:hypothetical protein